jgi:hypothetical protein
MSEATSGAAFVPGFRFAHPGYGVEMSVLFVALVVPPPIFIPWMGAVNRDISRRAGHL